MATHKNNPRNAEQIFMPFDIWVLSKFYMFHFYLKQHNNNKD